MQVAASYKLDPLIEWMERVGRAPAFTFCLLTVSQAGQRCHSPTTVSASP